MPEENETIDALRARLSGMEKEALVEFALELLTTYVVEGLDPVAGDGASVKADLVGEETFAGMLRRLKSERPTDPILQRFIVTGEHVQVRTPMGNVDVTEYQRPNAPAPAARPRPAAEQPERESSIYNRALEHKPAPASAPPASRPAASAPEKKEEKKDADRFRMIELD